MGDDLARRELAAIHVGKRELGLDDLTYRALLWTVARVRSAKDLDEAGRRAVIEHMRQRGFTRAGGKQPCGRKPAAPADRRALMNKLEMLLVSRAVPWTYAAAMAKKMFGVDRLEWATAGQLWKIIAALEIDERRRAARASNADAQPAHQAGPAK